MNIDPQKFLLSTKHLFSPAAPSFKLHQKSTNCVFHFIHPFSYFRSIEGGYLMMVKIPSIGLKGLEGYYVQVQVKVVEGK
jgi:hypothetical protein